jgi:hypothetical protein
MEIRKTASEVFTNMIDSGYNGDFYTPNVNHVIIDRSLFDGNNFEVRNGIIMNAENMSVLNSSILNIKAAGYETKAISSYKGGGPIAVVNSRLEAASINILTGGAVPENENKLLDGFLIRGNHIWKNPAWVNGGFAIKNLLELKHGKNIAAVGNIFENNYADAQAGEAILLGSLTDEGCSYCVTANVDFRNNKILNSRGGFNVVNMQSYTLPYPPYAHHIRFLNNYWELTNGRGNLTQGANYFEVIHNTFNALNTVPNDSVSYFSHYESGSVGVPIDYKAPGYKLLNNISYDVLGGLALRCDHANGAPALPDHLAPDYDVRKNVFGGAFADIHPIDNFYPQSVKPEFVNYTGGDFRLKSDSIYKGLGTDGKDLGADMATINLSTASARSEVWNSGTPTSTPTPQNCSPTVTVIEGDLFPGGLPAFAVTNGANSVTVDSVNSGTGLLSFTVVNATNATVNIPAFPSGTYNPVTATFTVNNSSLGYDFTLRAANQYHAIFIRVRCGTVTPY